MAAFLVASSHYLLSISYNSKFEFIAIVGVELFFPLSGFVLASQLQKLESNKKGFRIFFLRRWIRTIPPYLVALSCAAILFDSGGFLNYLRFASYTQNILIDNSSPNFYNVAWSLSVEEWFYLFVPLCLFALVNFAKGISNKLQTVCIATILVGIILKFIFMPLPEFWGEEIRRSVIFRIDSLCFGVLAFMWRKKLNKNILIINLITILAVFLYILNSTYLLAENQFLQFTFLPMCSLSFAITLAYLSKFKISGNLSIIGRFLANISYSMYLFHILFISLFQKLVIPNEIGFVLYFLLITGFSTVFYYFFEKPINDSRPK
jgi:peptidoglycan/LPS O-acetylase OafA/YrhL